MIHGESQEFFNAGDYFVDRNIRQGRGHKVAVYTEYRNYTYNDMHKMVNKTANGLRELGVQVDDRVIMLMLDVPSFMRSSGGRKNRRGADPVEYDADPQDYEYYLNDSRARVLVASEQLMPLVSQIKGDLLYLRDLIVISEKEGPAFRSGRNTDTPPRRSRRSLRPGTTPASGFTAQGPPGHRKERSTPNTTWW